MIGEGEKKSMIATAFQLCVPNELNGGDIYCPYWPEYGHEIEHMCALGRSVRWGMTSKLIWMTRMKQICSSWTPQHTIRCTDILSIALITAKIIVIDQF